MKIKCVQHFYDGFDPAVEKNITMKSGDILVVSDEKGKQLLTDFPGGFEKVVEEMKDFKKGPK